jgi:hypothetical protein
VQSKRQWNFSFGGVKMSKFSAGIFGTVLLVALVTGCGPVVAPDNFDGSTTNPGAVSLGAAATYVILAKTGISTTGTTTVAGDIGISPAGEGSLTGFNLIGDGPGTGSTTSNLVTGTLYAANYLDPTPANLIAAVSAMETAFTDAAGRAPDVTEYGAGDVSGKTLYRGVYKWSSGLLINTDITLSGSATDVFIFQIAQDLAIGNGVNITLSGGALWKNIYWQVSGQVTIGTTASVKGTILSQTQIVLNTGASLNGRALAQSAVTLDSNTVTNLGW